MTSTDLRQPALAPLPTKIPRGIFRTLAFSSIRATAERELDGKITGEEADERVERHADPALTTAARVQAYENLKDRVSFLAHLHSDEVDPDLYESDLETLARDAELDIEGHVGRLVGPRR